MRNILAIDASTKCTGLAIYQDNKLVHYCCITSSSTDTLKRIKIMVEGIAKIYKEYEINEVIMEDVLPEDVRHSQKTFNALHYLQAAVALKLHDFKQKLQLVNVNTWRRACGIPTGRNVVRESAKKLDMQFVADHFGITANDDICDAICIGWAYINIGFEEETKVEKRKKSTTLDIPEESAF